MKSGVGQPGARLLFAGYREESTKAGKRLICTHTDSLLSVRVDSVYDGFDGVPVVRRHSRVTNNNSAAVGIEFLSSAMLHGLAAPQEYDSELRIHVAMNSWMAEGQWHTFRLSEMAVVTSGSPFQAPAENAYAQRTISTIPRTGLDLRFN